MRTAYMLEHAQGMSPEDAQPRGPNVFLDLRGYAALTGMDLETVQSMFGHAPDQYEIPVGNVSCSNQKAGGPHAGQIRLGGVSNTWVKAKAYFRCAHETTGPGPAPPDSHVGWRLRMLLVRDPAWWKWTGAYNSFWRDGNEVVWYEDARPAQGGGTQVWFTYCENDVYENRVGVWFHMRYPWVYRGWNPMASANHTGNVTRCPNDP